MFRDFFSDYVFHLVYCFLEGRRISEKTAFRGTQTHVLSTDCTISIHLVSCFLEGIQVFLDIFRLISPFSRRYSHFFRNENNKIM